MKKLIFLFLLLAGMSFGQTTVAPFLNSEIQLLDNSGLVCSGCLLDTFAAGTTTPLATYSESTGTSLNANPIVLNSAGRATVYLTSASYKFRLRSALGVTLWTQDVISWATPLSTFAGISDAGTLTQTQPTAATNVANQSSFSDCMNGTYWTGAVSATDSWCLQGILGTGTNPTSMFTLTHSGSSGAATFSVPGNVSVGGTLGVTGAVTECQINNSFYVGCPTYPLTQAGVQQAFTDACTVRGNAGTIVNLPPMSLTLTATTGAQFTLTCALEVVGSGINQTTFVIGSSVPNTVPTFLYKPAVGSSSHPKFHGFYINGAGGHGGTGIRMDSTNVGIENFMIWDIYMTGGDNAANCIDFTGANNVGWGWIHDNHFECPVRLNTTTAVDSIYIEHNVWGVSTNTGPCVDASVVNGASHIMIKENNGSCLGGHVISHGAAGLKIRDNQFENTSGASTEANSAMIDIICDTYACNGVEITGNNLNAHANSTRNIRLGSCTDCAVFGNRLLEKPASGIGLDITGSSTGTVVGDNAYDQAGTADINDLGIRTQYRNNKAKLPGAGGVIPGGLFQAPADGQIALLARGNSGTQVSDLIQAQTSAGTPVFGVNQAGNPYTKEGTAPGALSGVDICYGDSTAHAYECSYNGGSFFRIPQVIGNGTAVMTTAGITTGACGTTVTVAATGVLTTDTINTARNAAATIGNGGGLTLNAWPTAGNVNFNYCNSAAGTITPTAMTINWNVTR